MARPSLLLPCCVGGRYVLWLLDRFQIDTSRRVGRGGRRWFSTVAGACGICFGGRGMRAAERGRGPAAIDALISISSPACVSLFGSNHALVSTRIIKGSGRGCTRSQAVFRLPRVRFVKQVPSGLWQVTPELSIFILAPNCAVFLLAGLTQARRTGESQSCRTIMGEKKKSVVHCAMVTK